MPKYSARTDKHILYQLAVQSPEDEARFCANLYRRFYGRDATHFREDFCGTALISCAWVKMRPRNRAFGVDLHQPTLAWGRRHNIAQLPPAAAKRVTLLNRDVTHVTAPKVHVVGAFNYSYFVFKQRTDLLRYFKAVRRSLHPRGLFVLDAYGGWEAQKTLSEKTRNKGFTYVWEQAVFNPINDHTLCHIHFKFPHGRPLKKAFTYDWRLWTLASIQDALLDAGFARTDVYWEDEDKDGQGNGNYRRRTTAENSSAWNAYVTAVP